MGMAVFVIPESDPSDRLASVVATADRPVLPGPLSKERREDLQTFSFLNGVACQGGKHPIAVRAGGDPPDRIVTCGSVNWNLELTELTVEHVRGNLAQARAFGRALEEALLDEPERFSHLVGRHVFASLDPTKTLEANKSPEYIKDIADAVAVDKDWVGKDVDFSQGVGDWPNSNGFYGNIGPFNVQVNLSDAMAGVISASASAQGDIRLSEAIAGLTDRIQDKDIAANQLLLVSCGVPDGRGFVCGFDEVIFLMLLEKIRADGFLPLQPTYLTSVVLHDWRSSRWIEAFRQTGAPCPWNV